MPGKSKYVMVVGVAAALTTAVALPALTPAQTPGGARTITLEDKVVAVAKDDLSPKSKSRVSLGDRLTTRQALFDPSSHSVGTLYTDCTGVGRTLPLFGGATLQCLLTYRLGDGQIVVAGTTSLTGAEPLSIVGGTGAYAGARGSVHIAQPAKGFDTADVITIAG